MPTYAYQCKACDYTFEAKQSFTDAALTDCPVCPGQVRKQFNSVGVVFKGAGFYRNDSRAGNTDSSKKSSSSTTATSTTSTSSTSSATTKSTSGTSSSTSTNSSTTKS